MNKAMHISILAVFLVCLVGCADQKKLECSITDNLVGKRKETYIVTYKNDKIIKQIVTTTIELQDEFEDLKDEFYKSIEESTDIDNSKKGIKANSSIKDNIIRKEIILITKDIDDETRSYYGFNENISLEELKKDFTSNGYSCK